MDWTELFGSDLKDIIDTTVKPKGLFCLPKKLSIDSCKTIIHHMKLEKWFSGETNQFMSFGPIPCWTRELEKIAMEYFPKILSQRQPLFDQLIANSYEPGEGLMPHIDLIDKFEDGILIASLQGACTIEFTREDVVYKIYSTPGDVILLADEARWDWKHGIPFTLVDEMDFVSIPRTCQRISLTLRKVS